MFKKTNKKRKNGGGFFQIPGVDDFSMMYNLEQRKIPQDRETGRRSMYEKTLNLKDLIAWQAGSKGNLWRFGVKSKRPIFSQVGHRIMSKFDEEWFDENLINENELDENFNYYKDRFYEFRLKPYSKQLYEIITGKSIEPPDENPNIFPDNEEISENNRKYFNELFGFDGAFDKFLENYKMLVQWWADNKDRKFSIDMSNEVDLNFLTHPTKTRGGKKTKRRRRRS
jgi:hypothetical protein